MTAEASPDTLQRHIAGTYVALRVAIAGVGLVLPVLLWAGGALFDGEPLRESMSAYYHSPAMRDSFVGALVAVGALLIAYRGFSTAENRALDLAGALAVGIALVPSAPPHEASADWITPHGVLSVSFFLSLAYVAIFRGADTLSLVRDARKAARLRTVYRALGLLMILAPLGAVVLSRTVRPESLTFFVEAAAVWAFASYWLVKSAEASATDAERLALEGKLKAAVRREVPVAAPGRLVQVAPDDPVFASAPHAATPSRER